MNRIVLFRDVDCGPHCSCSGARPLCLLTVALISQFAEKRPLTMRLAPDGPTPPASTQPMQFVRTASCATAQSFRAHELEQQHR